MKYSTKLNVGNILMYDLGDKYIVSEIEQDTYSLVNIRTGSTWCEPKKITGNITITKLTNDGFGLQYFSLVETSKDKSDVITREKIIEWNGGDQDELASYLVWLFSDPYNYEIGKNEIAEY